MHDPREPYLTTLKRILRYLRGTVDFGLLHRWSASTEHVVYSDADLAGCPDTRRSTPGYAVFLGGNLVSWSSKRQSVVSRSSAEAEYHAVANGVAEASWLRQLLAKLHSPLSRSVLVYCDNVSAVYLSTNPVQHQRTKHVEIDLHFVRDWVAVGAVRVLHVPTTSQFADISRPRPSLSSAPASTSPVASCVCGRPVCCTSFRVQSANSAAPVVQTAGGVRVCVMQAHVARPMRPMYSNYIATLVRVGPSNETLILTIFTKKDKNKLFKLCCILMDKSLCWLVVVGCSTQHMVLVSFVNSILDCF